MVSEVGERERQQRIASARRRGDKCICAICGFPKWRGVHQPPLGKPPGSPAWGHEFEPVTKGHLRC